MEILQHPDPVLKQISAPVERPIGNEVWALALDMMQAMHAHDGIGLAAIQVAKPLQLIVFGLPSALPLVMINPQVMTATPDTWEASEGCLSWGWGNLYKPVTRHRGLTVAYLDQWGGTQVREFYRWPARIVQHELDHLKGKMICDE